ncbi:MAG: hypothetical protein Q7T61_01180 [Caulobacter sp.]|nr:hypothetical protein [Caulobacter sp.]
MTKASLEELRKRAIASIEAERKRQVEVEGWTTAHDDEHDNGEMMRAGMAYLHYGTEYAPASWQDGRGIPMGWPWEAAWFKPKDRRANLVRAGALFLAERERVTRRNGRFTEPSVRHIEHKLNLAIDLLSALSATEEESQ